MNSDIRQSVLARLKEIGFDSMLQFCRANPILTFSQLVSAIGMDDVPPVLVVSILREETISNGVWDYFVKTAFVRSVTKHFPSGWMIGPNAEYRRGGVYANLCSLVGTDDDPPSGIRDRLRDLIPVGWNPTGVDDPIVIKLFDGLKFPLPLRESF